MSEAELQQNDDDPIIQAFLQDFGLQSNREIWRTGRGGALNDQERLYVPEKTLHSKLTRNHVQDLLNALFKGWDRPAPEAETIRSNCLRSFCVLLVIGHGRLIYLFSRHDHLHDRYLPHLTKPTNFPASTRIDLFEKFYKQQWSFCAQRMVYDMSSQLSTDVVLPFLSMEIIDEEGGSAIVHKIEIDQDHNELQPVDDADRVSLRFRSS